MENAEITDEDARRLLRERMSTAGRRVAMLAFVRGEPLSWAGLDNNGTVSFLSLPGGKFLVSNFHVWDEFDFGKKKDPTYRLLLLGEGLSAPIDISTADCVAKNEELDLCVLRYPPEEIEAAGKEFYEFASWPPVRASNGEVTAVAGYPGARRFPDNVRHPDLDEVVSLLRHELVLLYPQVEATSDRQVRLRFSSANPETIQLSPRPITEYRWGGMSGSLVYRFDATSSRFFPCGILHSTVGDGNAALFVATYLGCIRSDGSLITE